LEFSESFFLFILFLTSTTKFLKKENCIFIIGIYAVFTAVVIAFYVDFLTKFLSINSVIGSILIVISIMIYFSELLQSDEILNLKKSIYFWISLGVLLFNIGFIPVYIIAEFIVFGGVFKIITFLLNLLMISCFVTGFIVSKKEYN